MQFRRGDFEVPQSARAVESLDLQARARPRPPNHPNQSAAILSGSTWATMPWRFRVATFPENTTGGGGEREEVDLGIEQGEYRGDGITDPGIESIINLRATRTPLLGTKRLN